MAPQFTFTKAVKRDARARVAIVGPPGSGKSYTSLVLGRLLAGPKGKIAAVDTEKGSLSKYADVFDFDVLPLDSYSHQNFIGAHNAAEEAGYDVFITDSLSHFWMGKDGALEFVDMATKRHSDKMGGWKDFRPNERQMVDVMTGSKMHVIATMRTKTEYVEQTDERGKKKRVKIGLMPVQREGLEYEFDLVAYMDEENTFIIDKTRCSFYKKKAITEPKASDFKPFLEWLAGEKAEAPTQTTAAKTEAPKAAAPKPQAAPAAEAPKWDWKKAEPGFAELRDELGEIRYLELFWKYTADRDGNNGAKSVSELNDAEEAKAVYKAIFANLNPASQEKLKAPQAKPGETTPKAAPGAAQQDAGLTAMLARIKGIKSICEVFAELKSDCIESMGEQDGQMAYYAALNAEGAESANKFPSTEHARRAAGVIWHALVNHAKGAAA